MDKSKQKDLLRFDPTNASDDQIRAWLFAIIDAELEKNDDEIDEELIRECSDCEAYLSHSNADITNADYALGLAKIKEKAEALKEKSQNEKIIEFKPRKKQVVRRTLIIFAAVVATMILSVGVVAAFNGTNAWDFILDNIKRISTMKPGDVIEGDRITLVKGEITEEYDSVEEALKCEGFEGIFYPTVLSEGVKVEQITVYNWGNEKYEVSFEFNSDDIQYTVQNYTINNYDQMANKEKYVVEDRTFYITPSYDGTKYYAYCYYNGFEYCVMCTEHDELINILNNIK